jgi:hypothetical protein
MNVDELANRFAALPGARIGLYPASAAESEERAAGVRHLVATYSFLAKDPGYLDFLLRYGGGYVGRGPVEDPDACLLIFGFGEFADPMSGAPGVDDGYYFFAQLLCQFFDAEAEATKVLVNTAPPGLSAEEMRAYDHHHHEGKSHDVIASFLFPAEPSAEHGVYVVLWLDLKRQAALRWIAGSFLVWLEVTVSRGGLLTPEDLGLHLDLGPRTGADSTSGQSIESPTGDMGQFTAGN